MKLREWLQYGEGLLADSPHPERARRDAETLLLHHIGKNKAWLMAHGDDEYAGCSSIGYAALLERRCKGEPIQYIIGECEFYGLPFHVTPDVLIPRPETEHLVEKILDLTRSPGAPELSSETRKNAGAPCLPVLETWDTENLDQPPIPSAPGPSLLGTGETTTPGHPVRILDIGTGSGAIIVALATQLPNAVLTAIDISEPALSLARRNATRNNIANRIRFLQGDLLAPVAGEKFEIIASNPPYVPNTDRALISVEVREHEPHVALFGGQDGLEIYRRLIPAAYNALVSGGYLVLEFGFSQQPNIESLLTSAGFQQIEFTHDLQGIPRIASARRP
ncbi:N5-glutamine methyltransferase family protein [Occallatibacter savannae]|uniref:N5-glutamine methyltransferase family protein n=1 Tax=Occallatibacter savannae TaxID=1002691 RepID=UPI000D6956B5|nr:HemK/PrmC family methyltransferase [Occallatibacter savannae]